MKCAQIFGVAAALLTSSTSLAANEGHELPLTIRVVDTDGKPILSASIRSPLEEMRHSVNTQTGEWSATSLYPRDSYDPLPFVNGGEHLFDVSAAGYVSRLFRYELRPRRNLVVVTLDPMTEVEASCRGAFLQPNGPNDIPLPPVSFSIEDIERLGDLRNADPLLSAAFSVHLLSQGAERADEAMDWARLAMEEARGEMYGPAFVELTDQMYRVRAIALNLQWQTLELERLADVTVEKKQTEAARLAAADLAEEWLDWTEAAGTDNELARALCHSASEFPRRCHL